MQALCKYDPFQSNRPYIAAKYHETVVNHRSKYVTESLYFHHFHSPLCDWIVTKLPPWLAPNLITIWGFAWNLLCLAIMVYFYGNSLEGPYD